MAVNITSVAIESAADILTQASQKKFFAETIKADVAAGAPLNKDGTINLLHYAAWLVQQVSNGG